VKEPQPVDFRRATTEAEACAVLAEVGPEASVLAGGTDVMMQVARDELKPRVLLHIERIASLRVLAEEDDVTRIGALVTHLSLSKHAGVRRRHPALAEASATVGGWQTQAVGTLGGNICNASPAADTAPPLLVADARVTLVSTRGARTVALDDFFLGRRSIVREADELVTAIELTPLPAGAGEVYLKVGRRGAMEVARVGLAARLAFTPDGAVESARLAVCSVAPTPRRVPDAERILAGSDAGAEAVSAAAEALMAASSPVDDSRATAAYRVGVLPALLAQAVSVCRERAQRKES
jgi:carbon-monoxide dehydrogenase medium subunit